MVVPVLDMFVFVMPVISMLRSMVMGLFVAKRFVVTFLSVVVLLGLVVDFMARFLVVVTLLMMNIIVVDILVTRFFILVFLGIMMLLVMRLVVIARLLVSRLRVTAMVINWFFNNLMMLVARFLGSIVVLASVIVLIFKEATNGLRILLIMVVVDMFLFDSVPVICIVVMTMLVVIRIVIRLVMMWLSLVTVSVLII